ncbi:hypothetical protein [Reinekea thalattae]|uniref:Uncharacterized protein n=1 Tax=Reinekea thalattae TaxID=2593301 RepID=A0A5C8Z867_9GAMM|nr:hypothetical protein [Reinekea thalattae]TXR53847.1 hypothetical protein FME95_04630 [Reinekea thalattae]
MSEDTNGIKAAGAGAATGTVGSVAAVSTAGTVTGLGATGITSGLSAIGAIAGGGMATGLVITAAAPLAAGAIGYGLYRWFKD